MNIYSVDNNFQLDPLGHNDKWRDPTYNIDVPYDLRGGSIFYNGKIIGKWRGDIPRNGSRLQLRDNNYYYENALLPQARPVTTFTAANHLPEYINPLVKDSKVTIGPLTISKFLKFFSIYGFNEVKINDRAQLLLSFFSGIDYIGSGRVACSDKNYTDNMINIGCSVKCGDVISGGDILLRNRCKINGSVTSKGLTSLQDQSIQKNIKGLNVDYRKEEYPQLNSYEVGYLDYTLNEIRDPSGNPLEDKIIEDHWIMGSRGVNYIYFNNLILEPGAKLEILGGKTVIFIKNKFTMKARAETITGQNTDASDLIFIVGGVGKVFIDRNVRWRGTLIAPRADVEIMGGYNTPRYAGNEGSFSYVGSNDLFNIKGAFIGKKVEVHQNTPILYRPVEDLTEFVK